MRHIFFPWECADCHVKGRVRLPENATPADVTAAAGKVHLKKSPACHQREAARQLALLSTQRVTPRDRHILLSARIKRRVMADAMRTMRGTERAPPERSGPAWDEWLAKVSAQRQSTRKSFIHSLRLRKGYAFT